jgi:signal transduction histidine kinase
VTDGTASRPDGHKPGRLKEADVLRPANWRVRLAGLRVQLIVPYVVLTLATAMVGTFVVTRLVTSSVRERFVNQLYEAGRVAADGIVRRERVHLETLRLMAFTAGVPEALRARDERELLSLLQPVAINGLSQAVVALDREGGEVLGMVLDPGTGAYVLTRGSSFAGEPIVDRVVRGESDASGDKFVGVIQISSGAYLFTSAPVRDVAGDLAGVLLVGTRLDTLVDGLKAEALADIILQGRDGSPLATTFEVPDSEVESWALPADQAGTIDAVLLQEFSLWSRDYQAAYSPWLARGQWMGVLGVALPSNFLVTTEATSRDVFSLVFALGTVAIILLGYRLAQSIARPILRLRTMAQTVAQGDLDQNSGLSRDDEIGELAQAFDAMTGRLRARTAEAQRLYGEAIENNRQLAEMYDRLQAAQQQLVQSEKLAAVGQLAAGIVHDVKSPLGVIKGMAEEMLEDTGPAGPQADALQTIRDNASRANSIVADLLVFARQSTPRLQEHDLRGTVEGALRLTSFLTRKGRIEVQRDLPSQPAVAVFDPQQIQQVMINLIQNAVQAMPDGGKLHVGLAAADDHVVVTVRDTGVGIPPEHLARIFEPFFTTKPEGQGTGMGLAVSYGIVARHQGQITVESEVGAGSIFTLRLPKQRSQETPDEDALASPPLPSAGE